MKNNLEQEQALIEFVVKTAPDVDKERLEELITNAKVEMRDTITDIIVEQGNSWQKTVKKDVKGLGGEEYTDGYVYGIRSCGNALHVLAHALSGGKKGNIRDLKE